MHKRKTSVWIQGGSYASFHHQEQRRKLPLRKNTGRTHQVEPYEIPDIDYCFLTKKNNFKMCDRFNNSFYKGDCGLFHFFLSPMLEQTFPGGSKTCSALGTDQEISSFSHPSAHHRIFVSVPWDLNSRPAAFWDPAFSILTGLNIPVFTLAEGVGSRWESVFFFVSKVLFL